jgi:toxin ParE1/3/4
LKQATTYLLELEACFEPLLKLPKLGTKCDEIVVGYRSYSKASHIVYYRESQNKIEIIRIASKDGRESTFSQWLIFRRMVAPRL